MLRGSASVKLIYFKMYVWFLTKLAAGPTETVIALISITYSLFIRAGLSLNMNIALIYGCSTCS